MKDLGYADLNIPSKPESTVKARVVRALELGYQTVAINTVIHQESLFLKKKTSDKDNALSDFPEPTTVTLSETDYPELANKGLKPTILTRLTLVIKDNDFLIHYNKSNTAKKYDLLGLIPRSSNALQNALKSFRFDILSYDPELEHFHWNRKLYREALEKHVSFELNYAPMITDREHRRKIIALAYNYNFVGKCKGIILSSSAKRPIDLRSPTDVANLCCILSMNECRGREAVMKQCANVHKAALGRKMGVFRVRVDRVVQETTTAAVSAPVTVASVVDKEPEERREGIEVIDCSSSDSSVSAEDSDVENMEED
eukprot:TRINITY_DN274_c0_g1_i2.p2 TRINITY_DN274_c0_g1~~TRINITY_DN274_c0_g1_i2.p2  ORF type:complete len:314 (+),score=62.84 TRINITY_DN274_c0_g1_i2:1392-2333(+)